MTDQELTRIHRRGLSAIRISVNLLWLVASAISIYSWLSVAGTYLQALLLVIMFLAVSVSLVLDVIEHPAGKSPFRWKYLGKASFILMVGLVLVLTVARPEFLHSRNDPPNQTKIQIRSDAKEKTVVLLTKKAMGSATIIRRWGNVCLATTAKHVVYEGKSAAARFKVILNPAHGPAEARLSDGWVIGGDFLKNQDFALVAFELKGSEVAPAIVIPHDEEIKRGQFVAAVGHPNMERGDSALWDSSEGRVLSTSTAGILHSATVEHGSSGGGLFDGHGHLVGVNVTLNGNGHAMAVDLRPLLRSYTFDFFEVPADRTRWHVSPVSVERGQPVWVYALGGWTYSSGLSSEICDAGGSPEYQDYRLDARFPFASMLYRTDERQVRAISDDSWGQELPYGGKGLQGVLFQYPGVLQFRINHSLEGGAPSGSIRLIVIKKVT